MRERAATMERISIASSLEKLPPQRKRPGIGLPWWPSFSVFLIMMGIGIVAVAYAGQ